MTPRGLRFVTTLAFFLSSGIVPSQDPPSGVNPNGSITSDGWLALGPFAHRVICGNTDDLLTAHIAPSSLQAQAPEEGETIDYDPGLASTGGYQGPFQDGKPVWRVPLLLPGQPTLSLKGDADAFGQAAENVTTFLATYFEYLGASEVEAEVCVSGGDGLQVWLDGRLVHNNMMCDVASLGCGARDPVVISPGAHRILVGVWGSGRKFQMGLGIRVKDAFITDAHPDWVFCGRRKPRGFAIADDGLFAREVRTVSDPRLCPPRAGGPLTVTISARLPDGPNIPLVREVARGSFGAPQVEASDGGAVTERTVEPALSPLGVFQDARVITSKFPCEGTGSASFNDADGAYTLTSTGEGIWLNRDGFTYAYSRIEGDFVFSAHERESTRAVWPAPGLYGEIGGLLVRQDLSDRSRYALVQLDAWQSHFDGRLTHGGADNALFAPLMREAYLIRGTFRLERAGDTFTAYGSLEDGDQLVRIGSITWTHAPDSVLVGVAVSSYTDHCDEDPVKVVFDRVDLEGKRAPISFEPIGVEVTWRNVPRSVLRVGLTYRIDLAGGGVAFQGSAGDTFIFGDAGGEVLPAVRDMGPFSDPGFEHAHDVGVDCVVTDVRSPFPGSLVIAGAGHRFWAFEYDIQRSGSIGDQFTYAYQRVSGDFSVRVTVADKQFGGGSLGGELGIMARQDCSRNSRFTFLADRGSILGDTAFLSYRRVHGTSGYAKTTTLSEKQHPGALRLDRCGNAFVGYVLSEEDPDRPGQGTFGGKPGDWIEIGRQEWEPETPESLLLGLAVTSDHGCDVNTITFEDWRLYPACGEPPEPRFLRGDADSDGTVEITDAVRVLEYLFISGPKPECIDAADTDDSGDLDITDPILILDYLFLGGPEPAPPGPRECGVDPTAKDRLDCRTPSMRCR